LLVLDNCEHVLPAVARIVEVALGDADHTVECGILATSREPIGVDAETIWTLDPLRLPGEERFPAAAPAVELFLQRLRSATPALVVDEQVLDRAVQICAALDGLPLPIELAAARARSYTLDDIAEQVSADPSRLGRMGRGVADHRATVRSAIEWSHRMLPPAEQVAHRRIAVLPGPFTRGMAAAVIGDVPNDGVPADVDDLLAQLVHRSLLASDGARRPAGPTMFRQLATVRAHAHHALVDAGEDTETTDRRDAWTTDLIAARPRLGRPEEVDWYHALDDGYATVRATLARHLIDEPDALGGRLAPRLVYYWYYRARMLEGTRWLQLACDVLREGELVDALLARMTLATALAVQGRIDLAHPHIDHALEHLPLVPADRLVEVGECMIALITAAWVPAAWMPAAAQTVVTLHRRLDRVAERAADADLRLLTDAVGSVAALAAGGPDDAVRDAKRVHEQAVAAGNITAAWISAGAPMIVALLTAQPDEGIPWLRRLMRSHARFGTGGAGSFVENRANFAAQAGEYREAAKLYAVARTETRRAAMVWPRRQITHELLDRTRERLGRADYERAWQEGERLSVTDILRGGQGG
ncbi:MAG: hypothetical protein JOY78_20955, partial [Pseudonocardia sp.]|nr:hypothetical protein [Pseudonocardia sp.]